MAQSRLELAERIYRRKMQLARLKEAESILATMGHHVTATKRAGVILEDFFSLRHFESDSPSERRMRMMESTKHAISLFNDMLVRDYLELLSYDPKNPMALYWEIER